MILARFYLVSTVEINLAGDIVVAGQREDVASCCAGGDMPALLACLNVLREKARARDRKLYPMMAIQEAGLDGFWIHRALEAED